MTCHYPDLGSASDWFASTNQKHYPGLPSDASSVWNFCACSSDVTFCGETSSGVAKFWLFSQANIKPARACLGKCSVTLATIIMWPEPNRNCPYYNQSPLIRALMGPYKVPVLRECRILSGLNQKKCNGFLSPGTKKKLSVIMKCPLSGVLTVFLWQSFHLYGLECAIAARKWG